MHLRNKHFVVGLLAGIALTMLVLEIWGRILRQTIYSEAQPHMLQPLRASEARAPALRRPSLPKGETSLHDGWCIHSLDGQSISFEELQGKTVFLNFWATGCAPCIAEMSGIGRLYHSLKDTNVAFLAVTDEPVADVRRFLEKHPLDVPIYFSGKDQPGDLTGYGIPTTIILSPTGGIVFKHTGALNWDDPDARSYLLRLAGQGVRSH